MVLRPYNDRYLQDIFSHNLITLKLFKLSLIGYLLRFLDRILYIYHIIKLNLCYAEYMQKIYKNQKQKKCRFK